MSLGFASFTEQQRMFGDTFCSIYCLLNCSPLIKHSGCLLFVSQVLSEPLVLNSSMDQLYLDTGFVLKNQGRVFRIHERCFIYNLDELQFPNNDIQFIDFFCFVHFAANLYFFQDISKHICIIILENLFC